MLARLKRLINPARQYKWTKKQLETRRLVRTLNDGRIDLFLDVGANIGQTALALRRGGYRNRIVSFEPLGQCHATLLDLSRDDPDWAIHARCALGDADGEVEINVSAATDLSSIAKPTRAMSDALPKVRAETVEKTPVFQLDTILPGLTGDARRVFLKIDAQGHDMAVLRGAAGVLDTLAGLQVEMSLLPLYEGESLYLEILNHLDQVGFEVVTLVNRGYSEARGRQLQVDAVFVKKTAG